MPPVKTTFHKCKVKFSWQAISNPAIQNYEVRVKGANNEMFTLMTCNMNPTVSSCEVSMKELAMAPINLGPGQEIQNRVQVFPVT